MKSLTEFIDNKGPNSLDAALRHLLPSAARVEIHVAFATRQGIERLLRVLRRARAARIVVGLWQSFTEPEALRLLLDAQARSQGRIVARVLVERFHRKLYVVTKRTDICVIAGSMNLTIDGLTAMDEFSTLVNVTKNSTHARTIRGTLDHWWERAHPLSIELLRRYAQHCKGLPRRQHPRPFEFVRRIERLSKVSENVDAPLPRTPSQWVQHISGYVSTPTEQVIGDETNWDRRGLNWCSSDHRGEQAGDQILLLDWAATSPSLEVVRVVDSVRTAVPTPDGRYFMAYKSLRRPRRKRLTDTRRASLRRFGVNKKQRALKVSSARWAELLVAAGLE